MFLIGLRHKQTFSEAQIVFTWGTKKCRPIASVCFCDVQVSQKHTDQQHHLLAILRIGQMQCLWIQYSSEAFHQMARGVHSLPDLGTTFYILHRISALFWWFHKRRQFRITRQTVRPVSIKGPKQKRSDTTRTSAHIPKSNRVSTADRQSHNGADPTKRHILKCETVGSIASQPTHMQLNRIHRRRLYRYYWNVKYWLG